MGARLNETGYANVGWIDVGGRDADVEAINPSGEHAEIRLNDRGQIEREKAFER